MKIELTKEESETYFHNSLCNSLGEMSGYGLQLDWDKSQYRKAKADLKGENPCFEDILMQVLKNGGSLTMNDIEGEGSETKIITLKDVHEKVKLTDARHLIAMHDGSDDGETGDCILKTVFFGEIIFG
jgi:hypothetical protein